MRFPRVLSYDQNVGFVNNYNGILSYNATANENTLNEAISQENYHPPMNIEEQQ